ncbi:hypothetical protein BRC96_04215 [Halobacteriales archaeon QS_6_64_34]|nr:MAG: hypothetical protein BRC96_04215 [Halobacteriales archaeon QS_6_64_34]
MNNEFTETWLLDFTDPEAAAGWLETGDMPAGELRILVGESAEESEKPYHEDSFLGRTLAQIVRSVPTVLSGGSVHLELDATEIHISRVDSAEGVEIQQKIPDIPEENQPYEPIRIGTDAYATEIYRSVDEWRTIADRTYPALSESEWYRDLSNALDAAQAAMEQEDIEVPE